MKTRNEFFLMSPVCMAVQAACAALLFLPTVSLADAEEVDALTHVGSTIEVGVRNTSTDSAKFGEYTGLKNSGTGAVVNFLLRGGDAYNYGNGLINWELRGYELGTTSRELGGSVSSQGQWSLGFGYDELRHNITDTYQTPLLGAMGGNAYTLPATFGVVNTAFIAPVTFKSGAQALTATQLAAFRSTDVYTDRKNASFAAGYIFDRFWSVKFDYNRLEQSGAKLMSVSTDAAAAASGPGGSTWGVEKMMILMNPTNYTTDTFNLAAHWKDDKAYFSAGYVGSFFRDGYNSLTFPNPYASLNAGTPAMGALGTYPINTISTMPSNDFHQLNLNGGYNFSPARKLSAGLSFGRNTQDEPYPFAMLQSTVGVTGATALPMGSGQPPQASLNARVNTTHADLKLTEQASRDWLVSAGLRYNKRDNQTASNTYNFIDLGGKNRTAVNTPMSNSKMQIEVDGDYRIDPSNRLHVGYEYEGVRRWCNDALANTTHGVAPAGYVYTVNSCAQVPDSQESKLVLGYKLKGSEGLSFSAGYNFGKRKATVNDTFYNPMQALAEGFETTGYRAFFQASRTEQLAKAGVNWQVNDQWSLGLNGRYLNDRYGDSPLGVQRGHSWSANLDAVYNFSEQGAVSSYFSMQRRQRDLLNQAGHMPALTPGGLWTNQLKDQDSSVGVTLSQKGLMGGKVDLSGDLSYSSSKTGYATQVPYFVATAFAATCLNSASLICGDTPDVKSRIVTLKLTGSYLLDKKSKVTVGYMHERLRSSDYYYNFYQTGYTGTGNLPTNQQAASYSVNALAVTYQYNF